MSYCGVLSRRASEAITIAIDALDKAERQFRQYAEHHYAKGADDKAGTNYGYSLLCGDALERLKLLEPQKPREAENEDPEAYDPAGGGCSS